MNEELLNFLRKTSEEKNGIIKDASSILTYYVRDLDNSVVDKDMIIEEGSMMGLYCQPHHIAIPDHSHNYVELIICTVAVLSRLLIRPKGLNWKPATFFC